MNRLSLFSLLATLTLCSSNAIGNENQYKIEKNRTMYMECKGTGSPVVVLIAGYPERGDYAWDTSSNENNPLTVFSEISKLTKTCLYDRPGTIAVHGDTYQTSRSTPVKQPVNVKQQVDDLHKLINAAQLTKPLVFVAHSAGGLIARMYAHTYPNDLSGLLLLDVTTEDLKDKWTRNEWAIFDYSMNVIQDPQLSLDSSFEWLDMDVSFYQMQQAMGKGDKRAKLNIPYTVVITADQLPNAKALIDSDRWPKWATQQLADDIINKVHVSQKELAHSFNPPAKHITKTNSGHKIQEDQPQLVIDEIKRMLNQIKNGKAT